MILDLYLGDDTGLSVATLAAYANPDCKIVITTGSTLFPQGELFAMAPSGCRRLAQTGQQSGTAGCGRTLVQGGVLVPVPGRWRRGRDVRVQNA